VSAQLEASKAAPQVSTTPKAALPQQKQGSALHNQPSRPPHRVAAFCFTRNAHHCLKIARVLVRFDHVISNIVNANHKLSEKPKSHLAATAVGCDGPRDVDSVYSVFNGTMNRGDGLLGPASRQSIELFH